MVVSTRKLLAAVCCAIVATVMVLRVIEPRVDSLAAAFIDASAPDAELFLGGWWLALDISNRLAAFAFLTVVLSGIPLTGLSVIARVWPHAVPSVARNRRVLRLCLALQLMSLGLPIVVTLLAAAEGDGAMTIIMAVVALAYCIINFAAVGVWRELLQGIDPRPVLIRQL